MGDQLDDGLHAGQHVNRQCGGDIAAHRARGLLILLLVILSVHVTPLRAATLIGADTPSHRVTFAFHSAFLMNLHHFLFDMAVHPDKLAQVAWSSPPTPDEMRTLSSAVAYYRVHYGKLGIRDDPALVAIKRALSVIDARRDAANLGLAPALAAVLGDVAPVYARTLWARDDASNQTWIDGVERLDALHGAAIQAGIEQQLSAPFPDTPIRVDVVFDTGSRQGAYTDEQTVMPSSRGDYQVLASIEMLYHEASHTTVTAPLERAIAARLRATGRDEDSDLWHAVQFYTVGFVTGDVLARHGLPGYRPYADKRGLYAGYWAIYMPAINGGWADYLAGKTGLMQAVDTMVDALPAP